MIKGILFDMDGVLIDSEPFWRLAEIEVFATVGVHLSDQDCRQTMGLRIDEVVAFQYGLAPWKQPGQQQVAGLILDRVVELVRQRGKPLPGVVQAVTAAQASGLPMGIASSSSYRLIEATLDCLGLQEYFPIVHSAQHEALGKPHPAVYLAAADKLNVAASSCVAIEDSLNGIIAAKAARMRVVAIPDEEQGQDPRFVLADTRLHSLLEFPDWLRSVL